MVVWARLLKGGILMEYFTCAEKVHLLAGSGGLGSGYLEVMQELLKQADMQAHKPNRTLVWLQAIKPVFAVRPHIDR